MADRDDTERPSDADAEGEKISPPAESERKLPSSPWPSAYKTERPAPPEAPAVVVDESVPKAEWGAPLDRIDRAWTRLESRLCAGVLVLEIATLVGWIGLRAMATSGESGPGMIFRALLTAVAFGVVAHRLTRTHPSREAITTLTVVFGLFLGTRWGDAGVAYFANLFAWLQNASILVFFGGASDIAKRLTLWLALLGASVATAQGKHINLDVVMRFLTPRARVPIAVLGWVAAAAVAISASWGFFDYVCVEELRAPPTIPCGEGDPTAKRCPSPPSAKLDVLARATSRDLFLARRQLTLDLRTIPKILAGRSYAETMTAADWNAWLREGGWEQHFTAKDVDAFLLPEDGTVEHRNPAVTAIPGASESVPRLLVPLLDLVFAFGLFVIGLRFLLRSLLAIAGWVTIDPAAAHADEELAHVHDPSVVSGERDA